MNEENEPDELTPAVIRQTYMDVVNGTGNKKDVKRILESFCNPAGLDPRVFEESLLFLQRRLRAYLNGGTPVESALGLKRKKGHPRSDEKMQIEMAAAVLQRRLDGSSHQDALAAVSEVYGWGTTRIGDAWRGYQLDAILMLRLQRAADRYPWSVEEVERICKIFKDAPWFVAPGKSANSPA